MGRKKSNIIELFVDKIILATAGIVALWILVAFVIFSPSTVEYRGKEYTPGQIDESIYKEALKLQDKLRQEPQDHNSYDPKTSSYLALVKDSLKNIDINIDFPLPDSPNEASGIDKRTYQLPNIEQIKKPSVAVVTMAAFVPIEELSDTLTYKNAETKLADIDFVTVESDINAKLLYESFHSAFAGKNIRKEWREEQYAKPVFAKVELQRRTLQKDGSWGQWIETPKTKICYLKKATQPPAQAGEYEIPIAMQQFAKAEIRNEILQPPVYDNAIPAEKWLCPSLYNEREKRFKKEREELERQRLEEERARRLMERSSRTRPSTQRSTTPPRTRSATPAQPESRQTLTEEQQFDEILLSEKTNLANLEKLVFWAHDDTTKPGEKYQYRIRIGVFNPIAGKPWFSPEQKDLQNEVVLFSTFSEPTGTIEIPNKLHFFATDIRETEKGGVIDKTVEVKVARYTLGNWLSETFRVKAGEQIGTVSEKAGARLEKAGIQTGPIDLSTDAVMVDARRVTEWAGTSFLRAKDFYELLYCKPGQSIQTMPIKERYWLEEITKIYKEIEAAEAAEPVVLLTREEAVSGIGASRIKKGPAPSEAVPTPSPQIR